MYYGARAAKLSRILGCTVEEAEKYIESFWSGNLGVKLIIEYLEKFYKKHKYIVGLDGRKLEVRAEYKLLNTLIQSSAAVIFKRWSVIAVDRLEAQGLDCKQIIGYHDENQYRCLQDHEPLAKEIISQSAIDSGIYYNLYTPISCDVKSGANWSQTH